MVTLFDDPKRDRKWKDAIAMIICITVIVIATSYYLDDVLGDAGYNQYDAMSAYEMRGKAIPIATIEHYARAPDLHMGRLIKFEGTIKQIQQSGDSYVMMVKFNDYDVWVDYYHSSASGRPLEGDDIHVTGVFTGMKTYTTVLGASRTIPLVKAYYI